MNEWMFIPFFPREIEPKSQLWVEGRAVAAPGLDILETALPFFPSAGDRIWLMHWDFHPKHCGNLLGCGELEGTPTGNLIWSDDHCPELALLKHKLGFGSDDLSFLRVKNQRYFPNQTKQFFGMPFQIPLVKLNEYQCKLLTQLCDGASTVIDTNAWSATEPKRIAVKRRETRVRYIKYWAYAARGVKAEARLAEFLLDIVYGFQDTGAIPSLPILNDLLASGGSSGGMGPGTKWKPFAIGKQEYEDTVKNFTRFKLQSRKTETSIPNRRTFFY
ncbi:MAG TPA: hypothetical protein VEK08_02735 [Planctomycetota bacterium]|nr:hypothetical protein [Planctomycetota bacterium]